MTKKHLEIIFPNKITVFSNIITTIFNYNYYVKVEAGATCIARLAHHETFN